LKAYLDSDVLIWHLRGDKRTEQLLAALLEEPGWELWVGALQRAEIIFFARPNEETPTKAFLSLFHTAAVTETIVDRAAVLFKKWNPTHGTDVADAILAATAVETGGKILTLNAKHFPMPEVLVERAW
jgi:hypothetical protein